MRFHGSLLVTFRSFYTSQKKEQILLIILVYYYYFRYKANNSNFQIPKKYKEDPELGAWVAVIRRFGPDGVDQERRQSLDEIGFEWKSTRKCQSSFMNNFRLIRDTLKEQDEEIISSSSLEQFQSVLDGKDPNLWKWIKAQRAAYELDNLIEARVKYLNQLPFNWKEVS